VFLLLCCSEGRSHGESFEFDSQAAQLQSAVLDLTGEDQSAMTAQKRQYRCGCWLGLGAGAAAGAPVVMKSCACACVVKNTGLIWASSGNFVKSDYIRVFPLVKSR